jgi:hypothetical protein
MEEAPENGKELSRSVHAKGMNVYSIFTALQYVPKI